VRTWKIVRKSLREEVCRCCFGLKRVDVTSETLEKEFEITLELEVVTLARIDSP
jgi:hypothetical protein